MRHLFTVAIKGTPPDVGTPEVETLDGSAGEVLDFEDGNACVGGEEYRGGGEEATEVEFTEGS